MCEGLAPTPHVLLYITEFTDPYKKKYRFFHRARAPVLFMPQNFTATK
jgi:hypothetical protein